MLANNSKPIRFGNELKSQRVYIVPTLKYVDFDWKFMKIVGTANFQPLWRPFSCRLIRYTTTLQGLDPQNFSTKCMKFQGLFYIFIFETDMVYVKRSIFKKAPISAPCRFWGVPDPLNRNAPGPRPPKFFNKMHEISRFILHLYLWNWYGLCEKIHFQKSSNFSPLQILRGTRPPKP